MERKKILIIDDEEGFTRMVKLNLEGTGKYVVRTENKGALAVTAAKQFNPDLILLDIIMPDVEGAEVGGIFKEDESTKHIPIVYLTALVTKKDEEVHGSCRIIGGNTFLAKPVNLNDLIDCIEKNI